MHSHTQKLRKLHWVIALFVLVTAIAGSAYWYITYHANDIALPSYSGPIPSGARIRLGKGGISTSTISPDGNYLAIGNEVGVYLYHATTFKQLLVIPCSRVVFLEFSPDSHTLLSVSYTGDTIDFDGIYAVSLWDVRDGRLLRNFEIISEFVRFDVAWNDLHSPLLAVKRHHTIGKSDEGTIGQWSIRLIDTATTQSWQILATQNSIDDFILSPDGTKVAYNDGYGQVTLWDIQQKKAISEISPLGCTEFIFSPDGRMLFAATSNIINIYETETGNHLGQYSYSGGPIKLSISQDGSLLAGVYGKNITIWSVPDQVEIKTWVSGTKLIDVAWNPTSSAIFTRTDENQVYVWSTSTPQLLRILDGHSMGYLSSLSWSADSQMIATVERNYGSEKCTIFLWDINGNLIKKIDYPSAIGEIAWSPNNEWIVILFKEQLVFLERNSFEEVKSIEMAGIHNLSWSPDSKKLAVALDDRKVIVLNVATGDPLLTISASADWLPSPEFPNNPVLNVSWSPDGSKIAAGMWDGPAYIWDVNSGEQLAEFDHSYTAYSYVNSVIGIEWSPDGRYLAGGFIAGNILLYGDRIIPNSAITIWNTQTNETYRTLNAHYLQVMSVDWSPNSDILAFSLMEDTELSSIYLWDTNDESSLASNLYAVTTGIDRPNEVRWAPNGEMLAARFDNDTVVVWDSDEFPIAWP